MVECNLYDLNQSPEKDESKDAENYIAEIKKIAEERQYSKYFVKSLIAINCQNIELQRKQKEMSLRVMELTDFVDKSFDPQMKNHVLNIGNKDDIYFYRAKRYIYKYYPDNYVDDLQLNHILKRYGIFNYYLYFNGWFGSSILYISIMLIFLTPLIYWHDSIWPDSWFGGNDVEVYLLCVVVAGIISLIGTMILMLIFVYIFHMSEYIWFRLINK